MLRFYGDAAQLFQVPHSLTALRLHEAARLNEK
jgi:hypothetical protein